MRGGTNKIFIFALFLILMGIIMVAGALTFTSLFHPDTHSLPSRVLELLNHLGMALIIAGFVAGLIERTIALQHHNRIEGMLGQSQEIAEAGFQRIYVSRQQLFDDLFHKILKKTKKEVRIIGICVSLFREASRPERLSELGVEQVVKDLCEVIAKGCLLKVLLLKRYPSAEQLERYGISRAGTADFYYMRERDEERDDEFHQGQRLKMIANQAVGNLIDMYVVLAKRYQDSLVEERRTVLRRLEVREYIFLPSLSLYITDEDIYVTPYLSKRRCYSVPSFHLRGKETALFKAYNGHFESVWENEDFTTAAISKKFIDLLVETPQETIELYQKYVRQLSAEESEKAASDPSYKTHPLYHLVRERASELVVDEVGRKRVDGGMQKLLETNSLISSNILGEFVRQKEGGWNHRDWLELLERARRHGCQALTDDEIGLLLEGERSRYLKRK